MVKSRRGFADGRWGTWQAQYQPVLHSVIHPQLPFRELACQQGTQSLVLGRTNFYGGGGA